MARAGPRRASDGSGADAPRSAPLAAERGGPVPSAAARGTARTRMSRRCSAAARARGDQLAGTATLVPAFLVVEHPGPWGEVALRDSRLPRGTRDWLRRQAGETRVRVLLVRRPERSGRTATGPVRVFAVRTGEWCESTTLDRVEDVERIDLR